MLRASPIDLLRLNKQAMARREDAVRQVSSGKRVSIAADDAAGLGVATNLETTQLSRAMAFRNVSIAESVISTAESGLREIEDHLQRMRELAVASSSETLDDDERAYLADEFSERLDEIDAIASRTTFDDKQLLLGAGIDVAFMINTSLSMNLEISALLSAVSAFEQQFTDAGLDVSFALTEINAGKDTLDGSIRGADMGDGTFQAALAGLTTQFGLQDPYAAVLEATGLATITGDVDPDEIAFRVSARERHIIFLGDDPRELDLVPGSETAASVGSDLADAGYIVHAIIDTAVSGTFNPLVTATGGTTHDAGNVGQFIDSALSDIADIITARIGESEPYEVQVGVDSSENSRIELGLPVNVTASGLGLATRGVASVSAAREALDALDNALDTVNEARAVLGANSVRLSHTAARLIDAAVPLESAQSVIIDADMAGAVSEQVLAEVAANASMAALAQARGLAMNSISALLG